MRTALYVIYEESGRLPRDVSYMINGLKSEVDYLAVIVNGFIEGHEAIKKLADCLVIRENKGFDAGAYKVALSNAKIKEAASRSDELVFCNATFYGTFIPFKEIFGRMDASGADFWGLNYSDNGVSHFLQSYFLVFRRRILSDNVLDVFFDEHVDENTEDFMEVLINFEKGLFQYLVRKGYKFDALCRQTYHILGACDGSVCLDRLPLLKKKAFSKRYFERNALLNCLKYIDASYNYDIEMILEDVYDRYSIDIKLDEVRRHKLDIRAKKMERDYISREDILRFCEKFNLIYIYGTGRVYLKIKEVLGLLDRDAIAGFIVSDGAREHECFEGKKVYELSELKPNLDIPIMVALGIRNTREVMPCLAGFKNVLLWG